MTTRAERLGALRAALADRGVDGLFLPRTDSHLGEYLPPDAERTAWLTGFTGSAAQAIVLEREAAVFVDGRYTVQAAKELDPLLFERRSIPGEPPAAFLVERAREGARIGFDPKITRSSERAMLERALAAKSGVAVALDDNPIDAIWRDRPARPAEPVDGHPLEFAGKSSAEKRAELAEAIRAAGGDALVTVAADEIAWLLNARGSDIPYNPLALSFLVADADGGARWFVDRDRVRAPIDDAVRLEPYDAFWPALDAIAGAKVVIDPKTTPVAVALALEAAGSEIVAAPSPIAAAKAVKNPTELDGAREAHRRDGAAMVRFLAWLDRTVAAGKPLDEAQAAARLHRERAEDPRFRGPSFETISAWGANGALPHYRFDPAAPAPFGANGLYLVDSGGQYLDGTTDVTRTVAIGDPGDAARARVASVLKSHIAVDRCRFPKGANGAQIDAIARASLWARGFDFDHGLGHGVGSYLCVHEGPARLAKSGDVALEPGMILSNEPGAYVEGAFGVRIENLLVVEPERAIEGGDRPMRGFRALTLVPIDRRSFEPGALDRGERDWLDAYHARVAREIEPLLDDPEDRAWLRAACAPLGP